MIRDAPYPVEPWTVRERGLDLDVLAQSESVLRAVERAHRHARPRSRRASRTASRARTSTASSRSGRCRTPEGGYGYPESGQTMINVTDGKIIRLLVEDEPFDLRYGELLDHERTLDMRDGVLRRTAEWRSPAGARVRVTSRGWCRSCSARSRRSSGTWSRSTGTTTWSVQSELVANEPLPGAAADDPRAAAELGNSLVGESMRTRLPRRAGAPHQPQRAADGGRNGPPRRDPRAPPS